MLLLVVVCLERCAVLRLADTGQVVLSEDILNTMNGIGIVHLLRCLLESQGPNCSKDRRSNLTHHFFQTQPNTTINTTTIKA